VVASNAVAILPSPIEMTADERDAEWYANKDYVDEWNQRYADQNVHSVVDYFNLTVERHAKHGASRAVPPSTFFIRGQIPTSIV